MIPAGARDLAANAELFAERVEAARAAYDAATDERRCRAGFRLE